MSMAEDLVRRLREANANSTQRILGSDIFEAAADLIEQQAASLARFSDNMRQNYDAFTAMRNDINEIVGNMVSQESTLQYGPEMEHECEAVVEAVRASIAAKDAEIERLRARDSGGYAPDGKTWKEALFDEAERRGAAESRAEQEERALAVFDAADDKDWDRLIGFLDQSAHGQFWWEVLGRFRAFVAQPDSREGK
jgi:hypothetical protein